LPYEFFVVLWDKVGEFLAQVFNEAFASSAPEPLAPFLVGLICPIHKKGRVADHLSGYRPITLLNTDIKLLSKTVADRLHLPFDWLMSHLQSAFVEGRDIAENVLFHLRLAEYLFDSHHPAWLLITDLAGAYDNVDREFLLAALTAYGFKVDGHVRWAALLHQGSQCCVTMNGFLSRPFPLHTSLFQGLPASTLYWVAVVQPLMEGINSLSRSGRISMPAVPWCLSHPGVHAHADDLKCICSDPVQDGAALKQMCAEFAAASGVHLNVDKSAAVPLSQAARDYQEQQQQAQRGEGSQPPPAVTVPGLGFTIPPADKPKRLLGIPLTADYSLAQKESFGSRVGAMVAAGTAWGGLGLNFVGRAHVARQCIASITIYHATFIRPGLREERKMQGVCRGFAAHSSIPGDAAPIRGAHSGMQPAELLAALPKDAGGANLVHLPSVFSGLGAKNVLRAFGPRRHPA
jgi:hypothetical protein